MRPLSALDAITPAWNHTRNLLLAPRDWRLLLKIGLIAVFAGMGGGGCNFSFPGSSHSHPAGPVNLPLLMMGVMAIALISILGLAIGLVLFYIGSRLQFVLFDVILTRRTHIAPIWDHYGRVTWRWMGLKLLSGLAVLLCLAPIVIPAVFHFIHVFHPGDDALHPPLLAVLPAVLGFFAATLIVVLAAAVLLTLLFDFGLPSMALENTTIGTTVRRVFTLLRVEPGQCLLYLLMRVVLGFVCVLAAEIGLVLAGLLSAVPFGAAAAVLWGLLHNVGLTGKVAMFTGWALLAGVFVLLFIGVAIMVIGYIQCFLRAYAIYFLAGRYPLLGSVLEQNTPPPPAVTYPYTPYPPPA